MSITAKLKLKQTLLDSVESSRRKLMDEIRDLDKQVEAGTTDLTAVEQASKQAVSTFHQEVAVAVDTYVTSIALDKFCS